MPSAPGPLSAFNSYIQNFASGAHVAEARQRITALNEQARKALDDKAWAEADRAGTAAAFNTYLQSYASGGRCRAGACALAALDEQAREDADEGFDRRPAHEHRRSLQRLYPEFRFRRARGRGTPARDHARGGGTQGRGRQGLGGCPEGRHLSAYSTYLRISARRICRRRSRARCHDRRAGPERGADCRPFRKTCQAAAGVMVSLLGGSAADQDVKGYLTRSKRPESRSSRTGQRIRRSTNRVHAVGRLPPELCGVAHLRRENVARCRSADPAGRQPRRCRRCARPSTVLGRGATFAPGGLPLPFGTLRLRRFNKSGRFRALVAQGCFWQCPRHFRPGLSATSSLGVAATVQWSSCPVATKLGFLQ